MLRRRDRHRLAGAGVVGQRHRVLGQPGAVGVAVGALDHVQPARRRGDDHARAGCRRSRGRRRRRSGSRSKPAIVLVNRGRAEDRVHELDRRVAVAPTPPARGPRSSACGAQAVGPVVGRDESKVSTSAETSWCRRRSRRCRPVPPVASELGAAATVMYQIVAVGELAGLRPSETVYSLAGAACRAAGWAARSTSALRPPPVGLADRRPGRRSSCRPSAAPRRRRCR